MKKPFIAFLLIVLALPIIGQNQDEYKFSLVPRRIAAPTLTNYITRDGLTPLTADWNVGAFKITAAWLSATSGLYPMGGAKRNVLLGSEGGYYTGANSKDNIAIGYTAAWDVTDGANNVSIGKAAHLDLNTGSNNVAIGPNCMENLQSGSDNMAMGHNAGFFNISGSGNIFMGYAAGYYETGSSKLFIDNISRSSEADGRLKAMVYGEFASTPITQQLYFNSNVHARGGEITDILIDNIDSDTNEIDSLTWAGGYGMVIAACTTDGVTAIWRLEGTTLTAISVNALFTATADAVGTYNVYFAGGAIKIQNKVGDNKVVKLGFYGI